MGKDKIFYTDFPEYLRINFDTERIDTDIAIAIAKKTMPPVNYTVFVERIVALGKLYYVVQKFIPEKSEATLLGYSENQLQWCEKNAFSMWQFFMDKEYLYSTDKDLVRRFIDPAPFSKFYIENDVESPGSIGKWLGLQIVKSFMEYNEVSLQEMAATPPNEIFKRSKYKPPK